MFSRLGYSPASSYGSISPGSPSSPSSANHDHDRGSTSDTSPTAGDNGKRRPQKVSSSRVVSCDACIKAKRAVRPLSFVNARASWRPSELT